MREVTVCVGSIVVLPTTFPLAIYAFCFPSLCQVVVGEIWAKKAETATVASAGTSRSTGSLSAGAPGGIVTEGSPPKVSARSVPSLIEPPSPSSATCAASIVSGAVP